MSTTRKILEKIARVDRFIEIHEAKIQEELKRPNPNQGRIQHWEGEIRGAQKTRARYERRLKVLRRKG